MNLSVKIGTLKLRNPVMTASGTFGYGAEYAEFFDLESLGAIVVKGISLKPMEGNPPPRIYETPCGMLNAIGLQNVGLKVFLKEKLPWLRNFDLPVVVNILGKKPADYVRLARELSDAGLEALELNVSCPNVSQGGIEFGTDIKAMGKLVEKVRAAVGEHTTVIVKLSPRVTSIAAFARRAEEAGAHALSLINTMPGMAIDVEKRQPVLSNTIGGLSGPAIRPVAVRMVWEAARAVSIPIIGMGGIMNGRDAVEFILAGATAVASGTANFINPTAPLDILKGIEDYMERHGIEDINSLIGAVECS